MTEPPVRVLIVEDDPRIAGSLERGLARAGYTTAIAGTVTESLAGATWSRCSTISPTTP